MKKISPLGKRKGLGTFDTFFDTDKYEKVAQAHEANDVAVVDFVQDDDGVKYFEIYHTKNPDEKTTYRLQIQHFPFGIDHFDDEWAAHYAQEFLNKYKSWTKSTKKT